MAIARTDETDLLLPLHDGVHEAMPWQTFLARLRQRVRADAATLVVRGAEGGERWFAEPASGSQGDRAWRARLRPGRAYALDDEDYGRIVRADEPGGASAWLSVRRSARDFTAADGALLAGLAPHLATALHTLVALDRLRGERDVASDAARRGAIGWVAFAEDGRVLALAAAAAAVLGPRWIPGAVIGAVAPAVAACAQEQVARSVGGPVGAMLLVPWRGAAAMPVGVVGLIRTAASDAPSVDAALLATLFGLAPSEARLAAAIAGGASLAEAAALLGLTIETARNYSKRIFAKMRVRGQADLVRAVTSSVAWLA